MDNYKVCEDNIFVTINGIDTEKFSDTLDASDVCDEFGLNKEGNNIVYISRMDEDRSLVAKQLIGAVEKLDNIIEGLSLLIVGDGNDYDNVRALADKANEKIGREVIKLAGARIDIARLISPAKLFVGVSRSALEAMAEAKPVIIAGNEGYIGLFTEDKLQVGIDTNFCCRGCEQSTEEKLAQEIGEFFGMWEEDVEKISKYSRELIKEKYSVKKMADDTEAAYAACLENYKQ